MKKILKYASLVIITITLMFGFNLNAEAYCEGESATTCRVGERGVIYAGGNGYSYRAMKKNTSTNRNVPRNGVAYYSSFGVTAVGTGSRFNYYNDLNTSISTRAMYCLDAQYEGDNPIYAERFLIDSKNSIKLNAFDYAILNVITGGGNNPITVSTSNLNEYLARLIAARALSYTFDYYHTAGADNNHMRAFRANYTVAANWNKENATLINNFNAALAEAGSTAKLNTIAVYKGYNFSGTTVDRAKTLYTSALQATIEYLKNYKNNVNVTESVLAGDVEVDESVTDGVFVKKDVVHTIKVSGISKTSENKFVINGLKFENNKVYKGLTAYISNISIAGNVVCSSKSECDGFIGKDLIAAGYDFSQETTIEITAHFEGYRSVNEGVSKDVLKCGQSPIRYYIDGVYATNTNDLSSKYVATIWYSGEYQKQRYVGVEKVTDQTPSERSFAFSVNETFLIEACDCQDLEDACIEEATENGGSFDGPACQDLKDSNCGDCSWYDVVCEVDPTDPECDVEKRIELCDLNCETDWDKFWCCDEQNNEMYVSLADDKEVNIKGIKHDSDIKVCFVDKVDQLAKSNGDQNYANNANVEGVKDQNDNVFTLGSMKNNSYCTVSCKEDYLMTMPTGKLVSAGRYFTFKARVEGTKTCYTDTIDRDKFNKDIVDAQKALVDAYNEFARWSAAASVVSNPTPVSDTAGGRSCDPDDHSCTPCDGDSASTTNYSKSWSWTAYDYNGGSQTKHESYSSGSVSCGTCSCSVSPGVNRDSEHAANKANALTKLHNAQTKYQDIINEFNACSGDWENSGIKYGAKVTYDYEEDYLDKFGLEGTMNAYPDGDINNSNWYCNSNVNSSGEVIGSIVDVDSKYETCQNNSNTESRKFTTMTYLYCEDDVESGCGFDKSESSQDISDAKYKKSTSTYKVNYRPATLFYSIYPNRDITINADEPNAKPVEKEIDGLKYGGLPVYTYTSRGVHNYVVNIASLGEFYDTNKLGRYASSDTAIIDSDKISYACSYLVNIGYKDSEDKVVCDDKCNGLDCVNNCVGPNCEDACDGINCISNCIGLGCIYDADAGVSFEEKPISLNNMFPNDTNSYNWTNEKGKVTRSYIQDEDKSNGNEIYNTKPILSITIDPSTSRAIKDYNASQEPNGSDLEDRGSGSYSNKTLYCASLASYERGACYSSFIDDLLDGKYGNNVVDRENSMIADSNYRTRTDVDGNAGDYFEMWNKSEISEDLMIGPSWRLGGSD